LARVALDDNLTHYKSAIPQLFWSNAFLIASNGTESRIGSLSADWERFFEWKRIANAFAHYTGGGGCGWPIPRTEAVCGRAWPPLSARMTAAIRCGNRCR
jgi:hypothetical protein